jgi:zinc transport system substrate-binding protein
MKKIILLIFCVLMLCGCENNTLDNANIYTTIYPLEYITNYLYGDNSTIASIYPIGVNINDYKLTEKQIENYSSGQLFVYLGLGNEKEIAKSFINKNRNLLIIDATYGLMSDNIEELWLAPNNFLMLAKNIKNSLNDYLDNPLKEEAVNTKYEELYEKVSWLDAELRNIAREAAENGNKTIVVSSNVFKYLENYGFIVISLEDILNSNSTKARNDIKNKFKNDTYNSFIKLNSEENNELMDELIKSYKANSLEINDLVTNSDSANDYINIQYENIAIIRDLLLK